MFIIALGISLVTKANLGTSPISSIPYILSLKFPLSFGVFTFITNCVFIILQIIILKKEFPKKQYFQIAVIFIFSFFIDAAMSILFFVKPILLLQKLCVLIIGCAVLAFGIYLQNAADVIMNSAEGLVKSIAQKTKKSFGGIKIIFDVTLFAIACILSLLEFAGIRGLGIGTFICAVITGLLVKGYKRWLGW